MQALQGIKNKMTSAIWKYNLCIGQTRIDMPKGATIRMAQMQHERLTLWVQVNPDEKETEERWFRTYTTGSEFVVKDADGGKAEYITTIQLDNGDYVFHLFEIIK